MNTLHVDLLLAATVGVFYVLYVLVRVLGLRISWVFKLLITVPVIMFPIVGAAFVHLSIYKGKWMLRISVAADGASRKADYDASFTREGKLVSKQRVSVNLDG